MIDGLQKKIPELLAKLAIKDQAAKAWSKAFATLQVSKNPDVWMNFTPEAVGYNGYTIAGRELRFAVLAKRRTDTFVGQKPASPAGLPLDAHPHGLRKAAGRRLADTGCSPHEIMAVLGHSTLAEAERYTRKADRAGLSTGAITKLEGWKNNKPAQTSSLRFEDRSESQRQSCDL